MTSRMNATRLRNRRSTAGARLDDRTHMYSDELGAQLLRQNLQANGATVDQLVKEVGTTFGQPRLIGATGSFLERFRHPRQRHRRARLRRHGLRDRRPDPVLHLGADRVPLLLEHGMGGGGRRKGPSPIHPPADGARRRDEVGTTSGAHISGSDASRPVPSSRAKKRWRELRARLRESYPAYSARWWRSECVRRLTAARLFRRGPADGCRSAVLRRRPGGPGARDGAVRESTVWPHWLGSKLERSGTPTQRSALQRLLGLPAEPSGVPSYCREAEHLIMSLFPEAPPPRDPCLTLFLQPGVSAWRFRDRALVQRHGMTGVEVDASTAAGWRPDTAVWSGRSSDLDGDLLTAVRENFVLGRDQRGACRMSTVPVNDARRWAAVRAFASYLMLVEIRPSLHWRSRPIRRTSRPR